MTWLSSFPTERLVALRDLLKYSDAEPRDERGRWESGGGAPGNPADAPMERGYYYHATAVRNLPGIIARGFDPSRALALPGRTMFGGPDALSLGSYGGVLFRVPAARMPADTAPFQPETGDDYHTTATSIPPSDIQMWGADSHWHQLVAVKYIWDESEHPREPAGTPEGGEFAGGEEDKPWPERFQELNPGNNMFAFMPGIALRSARANGELSQEEKDALLGYQRDSTALNSVLRFGKTDQWMAPYNHDDPKDIAEYRDRAKVIDATIRDKGITDDKDRVVYRGVNGQSFTGRSSGFKNLVGSVIEDKGFLSTMPWNSGTEKFGSADLRITVPAGTPRVELYGDSEGTEYLYGSGSKLRIDEYFPRDYGSRPTFYATLVP